MSCIAYNYAGTPPIGVAKRQLLDAWEAWNLAESRIPSPRLGRARVGLKSFNQLPSIPPPSWGRLGGGCGITQLGLLSRIYPLCISPVYGGEVSQRPVATPVQRSCHETHTHGPRDLKSIRCCPMGRADMSQRSGPQSTPIRENASQSGDPVREDGASPVQFRISGTKQKRPRLTYELGPTPSNLERRRSRLHWL